MFKISFNVPHQNHIAVTRGEVEKKKFSNLDENLFGSYLVLNVFSKEWTLSGLVTTIKAFTII